MSAATLKAAALAILASGNAWCKGCCARDVNGLPCPPLSSRAVAWDVEGALLKAQHDSSETNWTNYHSVYGTLRSKIPGSYKNTDVESYNDGVAWSAIAALFA
jgi:hypothetical protein